MSSSEKRPDDHDSHSFDLLLSFLCNNRDLRAAESPGTPDTLGKRYETTREKLIHLFQWKGCPENEADQLADQTFDRIMKILQTGGDDFVRNFEGDAMHYVCRVGRNIFLEWLRKSPRQQPRDSVRTPEEAHSKELAQECLDLCMARVLDRTERDLIMGYYQGERRSKIDHRTEIASKNNLSVNALRIQVCRIRGRLRNCVIDCVSQKRFQENSISG